MPIPNQTGDAPDDKRVLEAVSHDGASSSAVAKGRELKLHLVDGIELHDRVIGKGRHQGEKEPFVEILTGDDLQKRTGSWMKKSRLIDRENDRYRETVTDPNTGTVIHSCDEPLSAHTGHGSAKRKDQERQG